MVRKKKIKISPSIVKLSSVLVLSFIFGMALYFMLVRFVKQSDYFKVQIIKKDPELTFINNRDFASIEGQSIFLVDLKTLQRKLSYKYPQAAHLRIKKHYPNQIEISARKRLPFAQTRLRNRTLTVDEKGIVLSTTVQEDEKFPFILGLNRKNKIVELGLPLRGKDIHTALRILRAFYAEQSLVSFGIANINMENMSKIKLNLTNKLRVIIDNENIDQRMKLLGVVLSQRKWDLKMMKYVDLRFKEPIIGKK